MPDKVFRYCKPVFINYIDISLVPGLNRRFPSGAQEYRH